MVNQLYFNPDHGKDNTGREKSPIWKLWNTNDAEDWVGNNDPEILIAKLVALGVASSDLKCI